MPAAVVHNVKENGVVPWWLLTQLLDLEKLIGYHEGALLTGLNLKRDEGGWFIIIKAQLDGESVVHFTGSRHYSDAFGMIMHEVTHGQLTWRHDKYA